MLMKTGILYFKTCFHGFGILRQVDPFACKDATHMINIGLNYGKPMKCPKCKEDKI